MTDFNKDDGIRTEGRLIKLEEADRRLTHEVQSLHNRMDSSLANLANKIALLTEGTKVMQESTKSMQDTLRVMQEDQRNNIKFQQELIRLQERFAGLDDLRVRHNKLEKKVNDNTEVTRPIRFFVLTVVSAAFGGLATYLVSLFTGSGG